MAATIQCLLHDCYEVSPQQMACVEGIHITLFSDLEAEVRGASKALVAAGIEPGDRVALRLHPSRFAVIVLLALLRRGAVACPLNLRQPEAVLRAQEKQLETRLTIASEDDLTWGQATLDRPENPPAYDFDQLAHILFTSGSLGQPRAR